MLEVYVPGGAQTAWATGESSRPFMILAVGALLHPAASDDSATPKDMARVVNVEHLIGETTIVVKDELWVYTEAVAVPPAVVRPSAWARPRRAAAPAADRPDGRNRDRRQTRLRRRTGGVASSVRLPNLSGLASITAVC